MEKRIHLVLVDQRAIVRHGFRDLLRHDDVEILATVTGAADAVTAAQTLLPDVVVADATLEPYAIEQIAAVGTGVLILIDGENSALLLTMLRAGASGVLRLSASHGEIMQALRTVAAGYAYLDRDAKAVLLEAFRTGAVVRRASDRVAGLSRRERQVLKLIARGYDPGEIGSQLKLSRKTVDTYRSRLMSKLEAHHRWELVDVALQSSLLSVES